ncbi:MAG: starch-binding protein, partial [Bacteroidia bacterium]|nr:starch-binding protein [Bacteroidia bacterium]
MKKYFLSFLFSLLCFSMNAQPAYLAGSSTGFNELNSTPSGSNMSIETRLNTTVAVKTCSAKADYSAWFKFTSSNSSWSPQWSASGAEKNITTNTYSSSAAEYVTGQNLKVDVLSGKYYTFIVGQNASANNDLSVLLSYEEPKTISSVTNGTPTENADIQISATLSSAIGVTSGEGAQYVRMAYTIDNTSYVTVNMNASGSTYTANIPASVNIADRTVKYFVFVTPISDLTPSTANFDYLYFTKSSIKTYCVGCTSTPITVKAKRPSSWTNDMYIFYWGGEISSPSWDDAELMENTGNDWYSYTFDPSITTTNIIFRNNNNTSGDENKTVDINAVSEDVCYELSQSGSTAATYLAVDCSNINPDVTNPEIRAHRNTVNENDFSDFASLYVYTNGILDSEDFTGATKYLWQKSTDGSVWSTFSEGRKYDINNIRPVKAGYYRCLVSKYCVSASKDSTLTSNQIQVTNTNGSTKTISSNLPIIIVHTDVKDFPIKPGGNGFLSSNEALAAGKEKISVDVKIIWDETSTDDQTNTYIGSDVTDMTRLYYDKKARMNYRGASSMNYDRRNYAFVVGDDSCTVSGTWVKDKKKMFNLNDTKDKDWILYAAYTDDTKMRNLLSMNLYDDMTGTWNSNGRYVRLYVNGEDKGIYIFMEKNKKETSRIQIADDGYVFKFDKTDIVDRVSSTEGGRCTFITNKTGWENIGTYGLVIDQAFEVVYPEWDEVDFTQEVWNQRMSALKTRLNEFETALAAGNYATVRNYIDYESWADNFIINEYTKNVDGYRISQFFNMSSATGLIKAAPLWDMELGFNNSSAYGAVEKGCTSTAGILAENSAVHSDSFTIPFWWTGSDRSSKGYGLLNDDCFKAKVKERWLKHTAVGGALNASNVQSEINKLITPLNISAPSVITNWVDPTSGRPAGLNTIISGYPTYISSASMSDLSDVALGSSAQMTVSVSGTGDYTYAWYFCTTNSINESDWTLLTDNGSATYSIASAKTTDDGFYRCVVTSQVCDCINKSVTARLSISAVNIIVYPDDDTMGSVTGSGSYPKGSTVTITAIPNVGYEFSHWDDGNTDNPRIFNDIQEEIEYAASFETAQYTLSISAGSGGTVNSIVNGTYAYGTVKELIASANGGYQFVSWSDGNLEATRSLTLTSDTTLTASFDVIKYLITVNAGVGGIVSGGGSYEYNSNVTLSATPNIGYSFNQWNDGVSTASRSIVVNSDATYTASFTKDTYTVSVTSGTGGSVNNVNGTYDYGSNIELVATPAANYHFVSWSDANTESTRTITVTGAVSLSASFAIDTYTVSVTSGTGGSVNN